MGALTDSATVVAQGLMGIASACAGLLVGRYVGRTRVRYRCDCGHSLAMHDPETGGCHAQQVRFISNNRADRKLMLCDCQRYVGKPGPQ